MIRLTGVQNITAFNREVDLAFAQMDRDLSSAFEAWTKKVFASIVRSTPQWTGDLAAAWNYSLGEPDENYFPLHNKSENNRTWSFANVYQRGAEPAVTIAKRKADRWHPTWRDVVYIHNPAPIADDVENLTVLIRPINLVDGRVAMVQYHVEKFQRGELSP
jgi:hypothetical protein